MQWVHRRRWEAIITETLALRPNKKADYIVLRSEQVNLGVLLICPILGSSLSLIARRDSFNLAGAVRALWNHPKCRSRNTKGDDPCSS